MDVAVVTLSIQLNFQAQRVLLLKKNVLPCTYVLMSDFARCFCVHPATVVISDYSNITLHF